MKPEPLTLLYLAHLNWDHVWQRPQQLMSRFAERCRVVYIDPPVRVEGSGQPVLWEQQSPTGVRVLRPIFGEKLIDEDEANYQALWLKLLPETLALAGPNTVLWVSSPRADYLVEAALPSVRTAVYDCMDDLASFLDGAEDLREREQKLIQSVDLLFTGGRSMYEARKHLHPRAYCFPSGVDVAHFRATTDPATQEPAAIADLSRPRLGYFGVLDERIDWELIAAVAQRRPDWQWTLVGPTAKIDPDALPAAPNIHYLGQQQYADLPGFLKGFDVATMPFALNQATKFISPTKTPEYLAGGKQVISTSVADVVASYSGIVRIADGPDQWIEAVEQTLAASETDRKQRLDRAADILAVSSWDGIAERMWSLVVERLAASPQPSAISRQVSTISRQPSAAAPILPKGA